MLFVLLVETGSGEAIVPAAIKSNWARILTVGVLRTPETLQQLYAVGEKERCDQVTRESGVIYTCTIEGGDLGRE